MDRLFLTWNVQCRMALVKDGLWRIVDGTEEPPAAKGEGREARKNFISRQDRALVIIAL